MKVRAVVCAVAVAASGACDRAPQTRVSEPGSPLQGTALVVGSSAEEWGLFTLPQAGGPADLRPLSDPDSVVWTGRSALPSAVEARVLEDGLIVLRQADGTVYRYAPEVDELEKIGRVGPDALWTSHAAAGVYRSAELAEVLAVSRPGAWRYEVTEPLRWAAPVEGGTLVLVGGDEGGSTAWLLRVGEEKAAEIGPVPGGPPGLVTAWGRRVALATADGAGLVVLTVGPIEPVGEVRLEGPIRALAASPSSHEIYASVDHPPRLVAANRFTLGHRVLAELPSPATTLRSSVFGDFLLARVGDGVYAVPAAGGPARPLEADWREDLPLGLPGDRVLAARGSDVVLWTGAAGSEATKLDTGSDRWWMPIHWNPAAGRVATDRLPGEPVEGPAAGSPDGLARPPMEGAAPPPGETPRGPPQPAAGRSATPQTGPPPGFYAIVGSAQARSGIADLVRSLALAGYPTAEQDVSDEAGRRWHRGLVGPYATRAQADAAARQLLRERRLQAWVTEISQSPRE